MYLSGYINRNRGGVVSSVARGTREGEWRELILFILETLCRQAAETKQRIPRSPIRSSLRFFRDSTLSLQDMDFRKRASHGVKELSSIIEQTRDELERYFELEGLLAMEPRFVNPVQAMEIASIDNVEAAAEKLRRTWGIGVMSSITRVFDLLEENEVRIFELDVNGSLDGLSGMIHDVPVVLLKRGAPVDRRRFTALHELGHYSPQGLPRESGERQSSGNHSPS